MTVAPKKIEWKLSGDIDARPLTRRHFLSTILSGLTSAYVVPSALDYLWGNRKLLAEAAELSREVVTVDLHRHPNLLGGPHFPDLDPDVSDNMKAGRLDVGLFAVRGDYPVIRRDASGRRYESRQPRTGELFQKAHDQLDRILDATKGVKIVLSRSPAEISDAKKNGVPSAVLAIEGSDPLEGELSRVNSSTTRACASCNSCITESTKSATSKRQIRAIKVSPRLDARSSRR
jgi:hypothetical protein